MNFKGFFWLVLLLVILGGCTSESINQEQMVSLPQVAGISELKLSDLNIAIRRNRNNAALYARRARYFQDANEHEKALHDINLAIDLDANKGEYYFQKALILRQAGNISLAQTAATDAEKLGYKGSEVYILQGELLIRLKRYAEAIEKINVALATIPNHEYALFYRGVARAALADTASAIINFRRAIKSSPDFVNPYLQLASIYNGKKEYDKVYYYLRRAEKMDSLSGYLWYQKGLRYNGLHQLDSAGLSWNKALALDPGLYKAHYQMGLLNYKRQNYQQVVFHLEKIKNESEPLPQLEEILADSYEKTGRFRLALQHYTKVLQNQPENIRAQWGVRRSNWGLYKIKRDSLRNLGLPVYYADTTKNTY
ncbi:MAG: hypothetical protein COW65_13190 [Cytophagales bacterium CG18_big_fil_WC_8_21_14_2_50_42_9]|nr:MAG: hypothetical protein COW65_13190 [Cytophagales bacterium CG18_big_fil_WC_8_21_14_2_50_42_9]